MRPIILAACVFAAGCSGQGLDAPTSPTSAGVALARTQARGDVQVPFRGAFTNETKGVFTPPTTLTVTGTATGHATHLGRFVATLVDVVDVRTASSTGTFNFTAANGDQLFTTTAGGEDEFTAPNVSHVTLVATIVGGTGRFAAASGTFTIHSIGAIDFATATSSGTGTFEGHINLNK